MLSRPLDPPRPAPRLRGECPSVHQPFPERDGALARIRLPGGVLASSAARAIAAVTAAVGAGPLELTNRANLQLRGIPSDAVDHLRDELVAAGVVPADARAEERRNVLASPTAGVDAEELVDTRPLVVAIAERLASGSAAQLSPKFGVLVDGGGAVHVRGRRHDLVLGAIRCGDGSVAYEVALDAALPVDPAEGADVRTVDPADVLDVADAVIALCAPYERARRLLDLTDPAWVWEELALRTGRAIERRPRSEVTTRVGPLGTARGIGRHRRAGRVWIGAGPTLGRVDAATLNALAALADRYSGGELRVTPWRGIVFADVREQDAAPLMTACERLGLSGDPTDPAQRVVACAGSRGCAAGWTDTQADAGRLIDRVRVGRVGREPISVHVSGCEKGCAQPGGSAISLVAGPDGTYDLYTGVADAGSPFGALICTRLDPDAAITVAAELAEA